MFRVSFSDLDDSMPAAAALKAQGMSSAYVAWSSLRLTAPKADVIAYLEVRIPPSLLSPPPLLPFPFML